jgi:hypothetical protein
MLAVATRLNNGENHGDQVMAISIEASHVFPKARRNWNVSVILRRNNLMRLLEFTRSTTLLRTSPAWPNMLWLWPESSAFRYCCQPLIILFLAGVAAALVRLAAASRPLRASRHHVARRRRKLMHEIHTAARRDDPVQPTSGLDAQRVADISRASVKALDDLWQRAMKNSPRTEGLGDNSARKAAQRIVKEIRARGNPRSFDGTEYESSLGEV